MRIFSRGSQSAGGTQGNSALERLGPWLARHRMSVRLGGAIAVVMLSAAGFLIMSYQRELSAQKDLEIQLTRLGDIAKAAPQRLEEVRLEFAKVQGAIPTAATKEIDIFQKLLAMADSKGLEVRIQYQGEDRKLVGSSNYRVLRFDLNTSGPYDIVWEFLRDLDGPPQGIKTLVLDKITLTVGEVTVASVGFLIYTQAVEK